MSFGPIVRNGVYSPAARRGLPVLSASSGLPMFAQQYGFGLTPGTNYSVSQIPFPTCAPTFTPAGDSPAEFDFSALEDAPVGLYAYLPESAHRASWRTAYNAGDSAAPALFAPVSGWGRGAPLDDFGTGLAGGHLTTASGGLWTPFFGNDPVQGRDFAQGRWNFAVSAVLDLHWYYPYLPYFAGNLGGDPSAPCHIYDYILADTVPFKWTFGGDSGTGKFRYDAGRGVNEFLFEYPWGADHPPPIFGVLRVSLELVYYSAPRHRVHGGVELDNFRSRRVFGPNDTPSGDAWGDRIAARLASVLGGWGFTLSTEGPGQGA